MQCNIDMHSSNTSDILGSLQNQILGLQMQPAATVYTQLYKDIQQKQQS